MNNYYASSKTLAKQNKISKKVLFSFISALFLCLTVPQQYAFYNPLWLVLLLIYWHIKLEFKETTNILYYSFFLGLIYDVITVNPLGLTAITYLCISYILVVLKPKIYFYTFVQIFLLITLLLLLNQVVIVFYSSYIGTIANITKIKFLAPIVLSLLLWPFLGIILDKFLLKIR